MAATSYFNFVQQLYIAYYQRPADPAGLRYWAEQIELADGNTNAVIAAFADSPEALALYSTIDDTTIGAVVDQIYLALFNRAPDAAGKEFFVNGFKAGTFTPGSIALAVLSGARNDDSLAIAHKLQVANLFTAQVDGRPLTDPGFGTGSSFNATYAGSADAQAARDILKTVTSNPATLLSAAQITEQIKSTIADPGDPILESDPPQPPIFTVTIRTADQSPVFTEKEGVDDQSGAVTINSGLTFLGTGTVTKATVTITNAKAGDELLFTNTSKIQGVVTTVGGGANVVLTLSAKPGQTPANTDFEVALESVKFNNTSGHPDTTDRTIEFKVGNGISTSPAATETVLVLATNDAPVLVLAVGAPVVEDAAATVDGLVVATYSAPTDEEGDTVTVGFTAGSNGDGYYALNTATREVTLTATGAAFVNGGGTLPTISLTATDNGTPSASSVQTVTPVTTFVNGAPVFTLSVGAPVVEHDAVTTAGLVVATYSAPTDEEGDTVTVDFTAGSNGDGYYALNTATREVTLTATGAAFVNGGGALPTISLTATDNGTPSASSVQTATLVTTLVNDAPVLSVAVGAPVVEDAAATVDGLVVATYSAPTDEEGDTVTVGFTAGSNGDGYYALNTATREVTLTATGAAFVNGGGTLPTISLTATDNGTPSASSVQTVTPVTTFVNGAPVFTLSVGAPVVEHDAVTTAGLVVATYSAPTDEEGDTVTVDFTAGSNGDGYYALNTATREVTLTATGAAFVNGGGALPTISLTATDNGTPSASSVQTATLVTTLVNDAPVLSVAVGAPVVEDAAATVDGLVVATYSAPTDEEGDTVTVGFTAGSNGDGYYALNTATREVTLTATGAAFVNGGGTLPTISLTATDNGTPSASSVQTVTPVTTFANDAPVVVASVGSISYTEGSAAVVVDAAITVADTDSSTLSSATVSISHGLQAGDTLVFVSTATITGAYNAGTGVLTLTGVDTVINYQAALRSITFQSTQENPQTSKTISWMVNDGTTNSEVVVRDVAVTPVNDAPVVTAGGTITYTENAAATVVSTTLTLSDVEGDTIASATASISANFVSGQDVLSFTPSGSITGSFDAGTGVLTLSGTGTTTEYQTVLRSVTYVNNSDDPSGAARTISFTATDSLGLTSGIASATVNVTPVNDAPLNAVTTSQVVLHSFTGTPLTGLSIADVDAGDATNLTATLAASDAASITIGSLSGGSTGGVSGGATIAGNGTATVTLTGSVAEINASLGGQNVVYKSADGFTSPTTPFTASTVTFTTNDAGNTGQDPGTTSNGTSEADVATIQVAVLPQVWFIDNTPPTSPSGPMGSQTNPFTSIEAFNDASALAGGPGANDYIYVQSGTYTGSGINLKDGQILLGADQALSFTNPFTNAVIAVEEGGGARPIIAVNVASDQAIDLASGNTIRGIHIVTVAGTSGLDDGTGITGGNVGNLTVSGMSITGAGQAVDIDQDGGVLNVVLETVSSSGGTHGIQLVGTSFTGTFSASEGMLSNHSVAELDLNGGAGTVGYAGSIGNGSGLSALISNRTGGTVTLSGDITDTNDVDGGISITSNSGGTITFSGVNNVLNSGVANALQISGTAGTVNFSGNLDINTTSGTGISVASSSANVNFTGSQITVNATGVGAGIGLTGNSGTVAFNNTGNGLDIVTATGTGFSASGGGTVTVQGSSNTISSPNATALSVNGTTIGSSALLFQRVSSGNNDGGADPVNGIVLINTGNLGGLTITGAGTADSGGIIASSTGSAIVATNTQDLNLAWMSILNPSNHGIIATDLRGVNSLSDSKVSGFGAGLGNTTSENGFEIVNNNVNMTSLTVTNTTFSNAGGANDGIFMEAQGTSNMALSVINSNFSQFYGDAIQVNGTAGSNGSVRLIVKDSDFTSAVSSGNGGISMNPWGDVNFFADINNNVFSGILNNVTTIGAIGMTNGMTADADVTIRNNDLDNIIGGRGITVTADGGTTDLLIDQNTIDGLGSGSKSAINISYTNNTGAGLGTVGTGNVTVSGNSIGQNGSPLWTGGDGSANAVLLQAMNGASMTALIQNNMVDANATLEVVRVSAASTVGNPGGTINATVTGNNIQDTSGTHVEFDATAGTSTLAGTVNLSVTGNTLNPSGVLQISEGAAGTINVAQANSAAVGTVNGDATVTVTGSPTFGVSPPSLPATPSLPLLARQGATGGQNADVLELATLQTMAEAAIARWVASGIGAAQLQLLESVSFGVADLKGSILGLSTTGLVLIDSNAAGWGWFVDETPMADEEFPWTTEMAGNMGARMDLLTVLMHELGHIIGLADHYPGDWGGVMDSYLDVGQRHMSEVQLVGISPEEIGA